MSATLIVIAMHLGHGRVSWREYQFATRAECQVALTKVVSRTAKTWRFCK